MHDLTPTPTAPDLETLNDGELTVLLSLCRAELGRRAVAADSSIGIEIPEDVQARIEREADALASGEDDPELRARVRAYALQILEERERSIRIGPKRVRQAREKVEAEA